MFTPVPSVEVGPVTPANVLRLVMPLAVQGASADEPSANVEGELLARVPGRDFPGARPLRHFLLQMNAPVLPTSCQSRTSTEMSKDTTPGALDCAVA